MDTKLVKELMPTWLRSVVIGLFIGILPGIGATTASMLSYSEEVRWSKDPESYGKGNPKGIAASESSNNAAAMGTLVPLLSLGIPGGATAAVMIGAFILHGMQPGPSMFREQIDIMYIIFVGLLLSNIFMYFMAFPFVNVFSKISKVPYALIGPLIILFCVIGTFAVRNSTFDLWVMFIFGVIGYIFEKIKFPVTPILLGVVLGPIAESQFRRSLELSNGSLSIFFTKPISCVLMIIAIIMLLVPIIQKFIKKK